jgi:hypothetical protein
LAASGYTMLKLTASKRHSNPGEQWAQPENGSFNEFF